MADKSVPSSVPGAGPRHLDMHATRATCDPTMGGGTAAQSSQPAASPMPDGSAGAPMADQE